MQQTDPIPGLRRHVWQELRRAMEGWDTPELCYLFRTGQPRVSNLRSGRIERFSLEQLIRFATRLNLSVTLDVRHAPSTPRAMEGAPKRLV